MRGKTLNFRNRSPQFSRLHLQILSFVWYLSTRTFPFPVSVAPFWEIAAWFRDVVDVCDQPSAKRRLASFADQNNKKRHLFHWFKRFLNEGRFLALSVLVWISKVIRWRPRISSAEVVSRWPPSAGLRSVRFFRIPIYASLWTGNGNGSLEMAVQR